MCIGDKVIKLREERELLGRFLIIQSSRPLLVPKLAETIGEYEMSIVPRSLCAVDRTLHIPTDKASLMHGVEDAKAKPQEVVEQPSLTQDSHPTVPQLDILQDNNQAVSQPDMM